MTDHADASAGHDDASGSDDDHAGGHDHSHDDGHDHDDGDHSHDDGHHHHDVETLGVAVVTVSSSRSLDDDPAGDAIQSALEAEGHEVVTRDLVGDSLDGVQGTVDHLVGREDVDVVVTTGGTGVTPDDVTVEAVRPLLEKRLPGFGELFRRLSYDEIGTKVVGTRAVAGVADGVPVFCLPGSENAATLGVEEIIVHEAGHLAGLARRDDADD
jgi:molybdenum cofactor biosynthesis protein B